MFPAIESTGLTPYANPRHSTPPGFPEGEPASKIALAPFKPPKLIRYSQIAQQPVQWLWTDRIAVGKLTLLVGEPGLGKGLLTVDLAARVSRGSAWPGASHERAPLGTAILLHAEDDARDTVRARLTAAGADLDRIVTFEMEPEEGQAQISQPFSLVEGLAVLDAALKATPDCRLVVIDPITAYLGDVCGNQNHEVRALLAALAELARRHQVAMVAVAHLNKQSSQRAVLRVMGALSFVATARTVWGVMRDVEKPDERLMLPLKNNLSEDNRGMRFRLSKFEGAPVPCIQWQAEAVPMSFQAFCDRKLSAADRQYENTENHVAVRLKEELADGPQPRQWLDFMVPGSEQQLYRAAQRLGVIKAKSGYSTGWTWMLPEHYAAWQVQQKLEQEQRKRQRLERKNKRRQHARAEKSETSADPSSNAPPDAASGNDSPPAGERCDERKSDERHSEACKPDERKPDECKTNERRTLIGQITPEMRRLFELRYPNMPAEQSLELLKQRFERTVKDGMAEEENKGA